MSVPSKSCHNCNVESDRAIRARGRGLPAWARALHRARGARADWRVRGLRCRRTCPRASSPLALAARSAPRCRAENLKPRPGRPGSGEVLGLSFTGQIEQCASYLRCFFRRRFIQESPVENLVSAGSLASCMQSVDVFAFALEMLAKHFTKDARRERALCLVAQRAASVKLLG